MAHTFTNLLYHLVWSTKGRRPIICETIRDDLHAYLGGVVRGIEGNALQVGGVEDHVHLLVVLPQTISVADAVRTIKANSSRWMHEQSADYAKFGWQIGYAAFTVSESQKPTVRRYIANQEEHHRRVSFVDEYLSLLKRHGITFDERFVLD